MKRQMCLSLLVLGLVLSPLCVVGNSAAQATPDGNSTTQAPATVIETSTNNNTASPVSSGSETASSPATLLNTSTTAPENATTTASPATSGPTVSSSSSISTTISMTAAPTTTPVTTTGSSAGNESQTTVTELISTSASTTTMPEASTVSATPAAVVTTDSGTVGTTSATPMSTNVTISETNLLLATGDLFVELKGEGSESLSDLTLVVFDGTSATEKVKVEFLNSSSNVFPASGILTHTIKSDKVTSLKLVVVALYLTKNYNSSVPNEGFMDFAILSINSSAKLDDSLKETMLPSDQPLVAKTGLKTSHNLSLSLSRCGRDQKNASMFVLCAQSKGQANLCNFTSNSTTYTLQLQKKEGKCKDSEAGQHQNKLENQLVGQINKRCQCGLTTWLVNGNLSCAGDLYLDFTIKESYSGQAERVITAFTAFTQGNASLSVGNLAYTVVNCISNCRTQGPHHQPSKANTSVTVAVVLSCVAVFLIILVSVILYMRGKRRGIIRQFRMTRLQEDDDMDDMEDFIGGREASFNARS